MKRRMKSGCKLSCATSIGRCLHLSSKGLFRHLRARGNWVVLWVVNSKDEMQECHELFGKEVDGLMTDMPTELADFAQQKAQEKV